MSNIRLFTALELPPVLRRALDVRAMERFMRGGRVQGLSLVPPDNLHVTVRFLGDVDEERIPEITEALRAAVAPIATGAIRLQDFGAFPTPQRPSVVWCGVAGDVLAPLEHAVTAALTPLGFPPEQREYHPHVTVARVREARTRRVISERLAAAPESTSGSGGDAGNGGGNREDGLLSGDIPVEHITLYSSSARRPDPSVPQSKSVHYEALARLPLATGTSASETERP